MHAHLLTFDQIGCLESIRQGLREGYQFARSTVGTLGTKMESFFAFNSDRVVTTLPALIAYSAPLCRPGTADASRHV